MRSRFAPANLQPQPSMPRYQDLIDQITADDRSRVDFFRACLARLGLEAASDESLIPPLSSLHLSSAAGDRVTELLCAWEDAIERKNGQELIRAEGDVFQICSDSAWDVKGLKESLDAPEDVYGLEGEDGVLDYSAITKRIIAHEDALPSTEVTPRFDHGRFFSSLQRYQKIEGRAEAWGEVLLYGDVVTSTNLLLYKSVSPLASILWSHAANQMPRNPKITSKLPTGFTFTASTQVTGRGRGTNVWVAPPGSLLFSVVINHPGHLAASRPIVFVQYIAAIAIVEAIRSYGSGYGDLPIKLKWPNDICKCLDRRICGSSCC